MTGKNFQDFPTGLEIRHGTFYMSRGGLLGQKELRGINF